MVAIAVVVDHGVGFDHLCIGEHLRTLVNEGKDVDGVIALHQFHLVTILILEAEEVGRLLDDGVGGARVAQD